MWQRHTGGRFTAKHGRIPRAKNGCETVDAYRFGATSDSEAHPHPHRRRRRLARIRVADGEAAVSLWQGNRPATWRHSTCHERARSKCRVQHQAGRQAGRHIDPTSQSTFATTSTSSFVEGGIVRINLHKSLKSYNLYYTCWEWP